MQTLVIRVQGILKATLQVTTDREDQARVKSIVDAYEGEDTIYSLKQNGEHITASKSGSEIFECAKMAAGGIIGKRMDIDEVLLFDMV